MVLHTFRKVSVALCLVWSSQCLATEPLSFIARTQGTPESWLTKQHTYLSRVNVDIVPGRPEEVIALVGANRARGAVAIVGIVVWSTLENGWQFLGAVEFGSADGWDYALQASDMVDLDGDGVREIGVREAVGQGSWFLRATTWYRLRKGELRPIYHLSRHMRSYDVEERREMVVEGPGILRERIEREKIIEGVAAEQTRLTYDMQLRMFPGSQGFAPVSTQVLR